MGVGMVVKGSLLCFCVSGFSDSCLFFCAAARSPLPFIRRVAACFPLTSIVWCKGAKDF